MHADRRLLAAALPAIAGSLLLMRRADAGTALITQQAVVAAVSFAGVALTRAPQLREGAIPWQAPALAVAVGLMWAPMWVGTPAGPERWLHVGGVRVYVASALLLVMVFVLAHELRPSSTTPRGLWWLLPAALWALAVQPDASQATAFALACALPI